MAFRSSCPFGKIRFDWVDLDKSLQWAAFQRLLQVLQERHNDVLVVVGPFNEHFMTTENQAVFRRLRDALGISADVLIGSGSPQPG